jgi:hypothetical protein
LAHHVHRQAALAGEHQQHQRLVPGKGQTVRAQRGIDGGLQDLLHAHHVGDCGHRLGRPDAVLPDLCGSIDRVERQWV